MQRSKNFKFDITLSRKRYDRKPDSIDYRQMSWERKHLTLSDFISHVSCGYSYCHIYHNNRRLKSKFLYSQVVSIDVDKSTVSLRAFLADCQLKPTFAYETFSNCLNGPQSYRLVYIFEERLNAAQFVEMYDKLCRMTNLSDTRDHCGKVITQLMNGTNKGAYVWSSDIIYSVKNDLPIDSMPTDDEEALFSEIITPNTPDVKKTIYVKPSSNSLSFNNNNNISSTNQKQYKSNDPNWKKLLEDHKEAIDILGKGREFFLDFYHQIFRVTRW